MDWDSKFSNIVRETEANLERIRQRLESVKNNQTDIASVSYPAVINTVSNRVSPAKRSISSTNVTNEPPIWATVLEEKIQKQNKIIDNLTETTVNLQREKETQKLVINELRETLQEIQERIREKGVNLDTENKFSQWKQQMQSDVQEMRQQLQHYKQNDTSNLSSRTSVSELKILVHDVKSACRDDIDAVRRDLDHFKTRLGRIENTVTQLADQIVDVQNKHQDMRNTMIDMTQSSQQNYRELAGALREKINSSTPINTAKSKNAVPTRKPFAHVNIEAGRTASLNGSAVEQPDQWRALISHSPSSLSIDSSDSSISSGHMPRRRSSEIPRDQSSKLLPGGIDFDSDDSNSASSRVSTPSSLSVNDL